MSNPYNIRIVFSNAADTFTLSASPAMVATLPETNLQRQEGAYVARSTSTAAQTIDFDSPQARVAAFEMFVLIGDFSETAKVSLTLYAGAGQTGDIVYTSEQQVWRALPWEDFGPWGEYEWGSGRVFAVAGAEPAAIQIPGDVLGDDYSTYLSGRIVVTDSSNPDGYHNLKRLFLGAIFRPTFNHDWSAALQPVTMTETERDEGGGLASFPGERYRTFTCNFSHLLQSEFSALWGGIISADRINDIFVDAQPQAIGVEQASFRFRAKLAEMPSVNKWAAGWYSASLKFEEVK